MSTFKALILAKYENSILMYSQVKYQMGEPIYILGLVEILRDLKVSFKFKLQSLIFSQTMITHKLYLVHFEVKLSI